MKAANNKNRINFIGLFYNSSGAKLP